MERVVLPERWKSQASHGAAHARLGKLVTCQPHVRPVCRGHARGGHVASGLCQHLHLLRSRGSFAALVHLRVHYDQHVSGVDRVLGLDPDTEDGAPGGRKDLRLQLHRREDQERISFLDLLPLLHQDLDHRGAQLSAHAALLLADDGALPLGAGLGWRLRRARRGSRLGSSSGCSTRRGWAGLAVGILLPHRNPLVVHQELQRPHLLSIEVSNGLELDL
mmetsp:Transcript_62940/g.167325  ORF Transcript_62940/g.167325 Transcript_62940/m.167325 type:complete len:219 (-) Transcript_62940:1649-2305(-)